jgi:predicted DNA binding CopG/RHH family protein
MTVPPLAAMTCIHKDRRLALLVPALTLTAIELMVASEGMPLKSAALNWK